MRVIFLEFDGVLHPASAASRFVPARPLKRAVQQAWLFRWAWILDELLEAHADVGIVVHSNWRMLAADEELQSFLGPLGRRFLGSTPRGSKWEGVSHVVQHNQLRHYRILDHAPQAFPAGLPELIACDPEMGLRAFGVRQQLQSWLDMCQHA
ncbi:HAD domain-containing protein [Noviherbaspirillum massiliense]|uniref:HAD domain-containing protein n=1 Tax=Noviherbaspirillum massiliense TaxID=1465823 RepID=UPI00031A6D61|nr:HAD domain-containing protein [Noviherbaspirillum massiliense]